MCTAQELVQQFATGKLKQVVDYQNSFYRARFVFLFLLLAFFWRPAEGLIIHTRFVAMVVIGFFLSVTHGLSLIHI